jgi:F0F1-type ATP synthase assembly protein I
VAQPGKKGIARAVEYSSLAMMLPCATAVGYVIGYYLDKAFHTQWLRIVFLILGSVGGFLELIRRVMQDTEDNTHHDGS